MLACSVMSDSLSDSHRVLMDYSLPGSPVPGILQTRTLEGVAIAFSRDLCLLHWQADSSQSEPPGRPLEKGTRWLCAHIPPSTRKGPC